MFFGAVQHATSSASTVLFITTCASVEKKDTMDHWTCAATSCCHLTARSWQSGVNDDLVGEGEIPGEVHGKHRAHAVLVEAIFKCANPILLVAIEGGAGCRSCCSSHPFLYILYSSAIF